MTTLNRLLDRFVRPEVHFLARSRSAFRVCGTLGTLLAIALALGLISRQGLSPWVMLWIALNAIATFLSLAMITKIVSREELIYYRHEIAVMCTSAVLLWVLGQPVAAYLDATLLGIGTFLACGRIGCLMVGCCYGRPYHRCGVRYRQEHAAAGFPDAFVGVRLFPVQLIESIFVFAIVAVGAGLVWQGSTPGAALAWYVISYDIGRFFLEFVRGDGVRKHWWGFSEGQWTSLILMWLVVGFEWRGWLPQTDWHLAAVLGLSFVMITAVVMRRWRHGDAYRLSLAGHLGELAALVNRPSSETLRSMTSPDQRPTVRTTSLGIRVSKGHSVEDGGSTEHYTFSSSGRPLEPKAAKILARQLDRLRPDGRRGHLIRGGRGCFHWLSGRER